MSGQSQKRRQADGRTRKGNRWNRRGLTQAALGASHSKDIYLRSFYWRIASTRGDKKARIATAHQQLEITCIIIRVGVHFKEPGANHLALRHTETHAEVSGEPAGGFRL